MQYKSDRGFLFVFIILLVSKISCTEFTLVNLDLFKTDVYFKKCEIKFFDFDFMSTQSGQHFLTSTNRPILISNKIKAEAKFYSSRYQLERCKIIIAVQDNNTEPLNNLLNLLAFKDSNYFIIFNLTLKFIHSGELAKFNSLIHVLIQSKTTKDSYQGYDYIQRCNCLKLAQVPFSNLVALSQKDRWNFNKQIVFVGIISGIDKIGPLCPDWYTRLGCSVQPKIIEIHGNHLNFTPYYKPSLTVQKFLWENSLYEKDIYTYISDNVIYEWNPVYSNDSLQNFFTYSESFTLVYCEDELRFPGISFQYWVSPFRLNVWVFIIALIFITSVIISNGNLKCLQFALFIHVSCFLRQGVPDRISILQVGFIFVAILISTLYECVITADVTIPDPPVIARDPKELLVDWGYHINHKVSARLKEFDAPFHFRGFEKYKITALYKEKLRISLESDDKALGKTSSKSSAIITAWDKLFVDYAYKMIYPQRFCHTTLESFFSLHKSYFSKGRGAFKIMCLMQQMKEGGFFRHWEDRLLSVLLNIAIRRIKQPELEALEVSPTPLKGKIKHIFEIYAIGNCLAILWFIGNYMFRYMVGIISKELHILVKLPSFAL